MKVMIAGAGAVGTYIAEDLTRSGHDVWMRKEEWKIK
jgi:Trk K+ transport system NAD-binding subunit